MGPVISPLDKGQIPLIGGSGGVSGGSPPVIPGLTQLDPATMRSLMRKKLGLDDDESEENPGETDWSTQPPPALLKAFARIFMAAGQYEGLQAAMMSIARNLARNVPASSPDELPSAFSTADIMRNPSVPPAMQ